MYISHSERCKTLQQVSQKDRETDLSHLRLNFRIILDYSTRARDQQGQTLHPQTLHSKGEGSWR